MVTTLHDLTLAAQYPDRVLLLDGGQVAAVGTPAEVLTAERVSRHYAANVTVLTAPDGSPVVTPTRP